MKKLWISILLSFLLSTHTTSQVQGDDVLKRRFQQDYPTALANLEVRYHLMYGQADYVEFQSYPGRPPEESALAIDFAFTPEAAKLTTSAKDWAEGERKESPGRYQVVLGVNPDYAYRLTRPQPKDDLMVNEILEDSAKGLLNIMNSHGFEIQAAYNPVGCSLPVRLKNGRLQVDDVLDEVSASGLKCLLVKYTSQPSRWVNVPGQRIYGWFLVSPTEGWIVREGGQVITTRKGSTTEFSKVDYVKSGDGHLDPVKHSMRRYGGIITREDQSHAKPIFGFDLTFKSMKYEALPPAEFRLPAFGLPELAEPGKKGASTFQPYGLFALAFAGFGAAGGLKYLAARVKRT